MTQQLSRRFGPRPVATATRPWLLRIGDRRPLAGSRLLRDPLLRERRART
jgi:hypothetical protein